MSVKVIIGAMLMGLPLAGLFVAHVCMQGWQAATGIWVGSIALTGIIVLGACLATGLI